MLKDVHECLLLKQQNANKPSPLKQIVAPYATHRKGVRYSGELYDRPASMSKVQEDEIAYKTINATPRNKRLIEKRSAQGRLATKAATKPTMSENFLESPEDKPIGIYKDVFDAILAEFPGSEREASRGVIVRIDGEHVADVYAFGPNDEDLTDDEDADEIDNPKVAALPVTWFNIMGDDDMVVAKFLMAKFGVQEAEM